MDSRKKINNMYMCPKCGARPQIKFSVGKRDDSGYPVVASVMCSNCALSTGTFKFNNLEYAQNRWNELVDTYE